LYFSELSILRGALTWRHYSRFYSSLKKGSPSASWKRWGTSNQSVTGRTLEYFSQFIYKVTSKTKLFKYINEKETPGGNCILRGGDAEEVLTSEGHLWQDRTTKKYERTANKTDIGFCCSEKIRISQNKNMCLARILENGVCNTTQKKHEIHAGENMQTVKKRTDKIEGKNLINWNFLSH